MTLKGGVQIRLRQMPCVAGLGKDAKIGKPQSLYQHFCLGTDAAPLGNAKHRMEKQHHGQGDDAAGCQCQIYGGFSHYRFDGFDR